MKCANCGAEIKVGNIYCANCGKEIQLVPEYNISEDDIFQEVKQQEEQRLKEEEAAKRQELKEENLKKRKKKTLIIIMAILLVLIIAVVLMISAVSRRNHNNSFDYQLRKAQEEFAADDYDEALTYVQRAITLDGESIDAYLLEGKCYANLLEYKSAIRDFEMVLSLDETNQDAIEELINVYSTDVNAYYNDCLALAQSVTAKDDSLLGLFSDILIAQPQFSTYGGVFTEPLEIELTATDASYSIYYTLDGSEPGTASTLYTEPIELSDGDNILSAICVDSEGHMSLYRQETYSLELTPPEAPSISLPSGTYNEQTDISISVPEGATAYYTWDGSEPTQSSAGYSRPLQLIEGNNILSVIIYDQHGLSSAVVSRSYLYLPEDEDPAEEDTVEAYEVETLN